MERKAKVDFTNVDKQKKSTYIIGIMSDDIMDHLPNDTRWCIQ